MDDIEVRLLLALDAATRPSVLELSRVLGIARNTVQARLDRLRARGVIHGYEPVVSREAVGLHVLAFVSLQVAQGHEAPVIEGLRRLPEVLEAHKTTGEADLLLRVVARSNQHLNTVLEALLGLPGVVRSTTSLALSTAVDRSILGAIRDGLLDG